MALTTQQVICLCCHFKTVCLSIVFHFTYCSAGAYKPVTPDMTCFALFCLTYVWVCFLKPDSMPISVLHCGTFSLSFCVMVFIDFIGHTETCICVLLDYQSCRGDWWHRTMQPKHFFSFSCHLVCWNLSVCFFTPLSFFTLCPFALVVIFLFDWNF